MTETTDLKLGIVLREARQERQLQLATIAANLRIKEHYLAALESGDYAQLPAGAHAKGFLRSYAQYIGLGDRLPELQELYRRETTDEEPPLQMPQPLPEGKLPSARLILSTLCAAGLIYIIWYSLQTTPPVSVVAPPPAPVVEQPVVAEPVPAPTPEPQAQITFSPAPPIETPAQSTPVTEPVAAPPAAETTPAKPAKIVRATAPAWVQVQDKQGTTIYSRLLNKGEEYAVPDQPGLRLTTGNGAGVVIVDGDKVGKPLGRPAEVIRNIRLTADSEAAKPAPKPAAPKPATSVEPKKEPVEDLPPEDESYD